MRRPLAQTLLAILFGGIVGLYLLSFLATLVVSGDGWLVGILAFFLTALAHNLRKGSWFAKRPFELPVLWKVSGPLCMGLFLAFLGASMTFGGPGLVSFGGPEIGAEAILAPREQYLFDNGVEGSRWRFVLAALLFQLAWHLFGIAIALDDWIGVLRERLQGDPGVGPPGGPKALRGDWAKLLKLAAGARRGRFSRTHMKRMRRFVYFVQGSSPFTYLLGTMVIVAITGNLAGVMGSRAIGVPVGLAFLVVWLGFAFDLVLSIWEKEIVDSIWMTLWVLGWGAVTMVVIRWVVLGS